MARSKRTQTRCFSGILRRILCTGSIPTHPSEQIAESAKATPEPELFQKKQGETGEEKRDGAGGNNAESGLMAAPGIVARLMGLDSMPIVGWDPKKGTAVARGSFLGRSRSMNSLEYLLRFERMQASESFRARPSSSFREPPTFLHPQKSSDLAGRCSDGETEGGGSSKQSSPEIGCGRKLKQRKTERGIGMEKYQDKNRKGCKAMKKVEHLSGIDGKFRSKPMMNHCNGSPERNENVCRKPNPISKSKHPTKPIGKKQLSVNFKSGKRKNSHRPFQKVVPECYVESVQPPSPEDDSEAISSTLTEREEKKKRSSSPSEWAKCEDPFPNRVLFSDIDGNYEPAALINSYPKDVDQGRISCPALEARYYLDLLRKVNNLAEEDVKSSNWVDKLPLLGIGFGEYEELCGVFGEQIVEQLVCEFVDERFGIPQGKLAW